MPEYTVLQATKQEREPVIQGSTFHCYLLSLEGREGKVELLQKPSTAAPQAGEKIDGTIEPGKEKQDGSKWPDKLKRASQGRQGQSYDPGRDRRITRQHSQEMAIRFAALVGFKDKPIEELLTFIDWFDQDVFGREPVKEEVAPAREAVPAIPLDRAKAILDKAVAAKLAEGTELSATLKAKLTEVGVETGRIGHLNVDQAETVEAWIEAERANG